MNVLKIFNLSLVWDIWWIPWDKFDTMVLKKIFLYFVMHLDILRTDGIET